MAQLQLAPPRVAVAARAQMGLRSPASDGFGALIFLVVYPWRLVPSWQYCGCHRGPEHARGEAIARSSSTRWRAGRTDPMVDDGDMSRQPRSPALRRHPAAIGTGHHRKPAVRAERPTGKPIAERDGSTDISFDLELLRAGSALGEHDRRWRPCRGSGAAVCGAQAAARRDQAAAGASDPDRQPDRWGAGAADGLTEQLSLIDEELDGPAKPARQGPCAGGRVLALQRERAGLAGAWPRSSDDLGHRGKRCRIAEIEIEILQPRQCPARRGDHHLRDVSSARWSCGNGASRPSRPSRGLMCVHLCPGVVLRPRPCTHSARSCGRPTRSCISCRRTTSW
jgi:hypothetical protein